MADEDDNKDDVTEDEESTEEDESGQENEDGKESEDDGPVDREEYKKKVEELERVKKNLAKRNQDLVRIRNKQNDAKQKEATKQKEEDSELAASLREKEAEIEKLRNQSIRSSAVSALAESGVVSKHLKRAVRLINTAELSLDDEGEIIGLESQVDELREEFPEFFQEEEKKVVRKRPTVSKNARKDAGDKGDGGEGKKKMSSAERLAVNLIGDRK